MNRILVKIREDVLHVQRNDLFEQFGATVKKEYKNIKGIYSLELPSDCNVDSVLDEMKESEFVAYAEKDVKATLILLHIAKIFLRYL